MALDGMDMNFDLRDILQGMPSPPVAPTPPPTAEPGPTGPVGPTPGPGAGVLPPGYGINPQDVMRQIMQMMLSQQLGAFFNPNARGPSQFTPGDATFAPPAPPGVPGPFPQIGPLPPPNMPWTLPGLIGGQGPTAHRPGGPVPGALPIPAIRGPNIPGGNPELAYASGASAGMPVGGPLGVPVIEPMLDTSYLQPNPNWDLRGRMGTMVPELQGPQGMMNSPYAFISELLRQMAQGGWPVNA